MFVRGIGMEGAIGPVAGSSHHSLYFRMPGVKIVSPMTPGEYKKIYKSFMSEEEVYYVSEHRGSFNNKKELIDDITGTKDFVIIAISITRFQAIEAKKKLEKKGTKSVSFIFCGLNLLRYLKKHLNVFLTLDLEGL